MSCAKLLLSGSVKDIYDEGLEGELTFLFSDRYSIFDWGQMPDLIEDKGLCLSLMAQYFFGFIDNPESWKNWDACKWQLSTHQMELYNKYCQGSFAHHFLGTSTNVPHGLRVRKFHIPNVRNAQEYDYSFYQKREQAKNALIPLEVIFRFGVPKGSSLVSRRPEFSVGQRFKMPLIEFSTKLEDRDRYISDQEAQTMAGFSDQEFKNFREIVELLSIRLHDSLKDLNLELWDGKFEFAFDEQRQIVLVDTIGPDELRLMIDDNPLSKEFVREYYENTKWKNELDSAKNEKNWKEMMLKHHCLPEALHPDYRLAFSHMYKALVNRLYREPVFKEVKDLDIMTQEIVRLRENRR